MEQHYPPSETASATNVPPPPAYDDTTAPADHRPDEKDPALYEDDSSFISSRDSAVDGGKQGGRGEERGRSTTRASSSRGDVVRQRSRRALNRAKVMLDKATDYSVAVGHEGHEYIAKGPNTIWEYDFLKWAFEKTGVTPLVKRSWAHLEVENKMRRRL